MQTQGGVSDSSPWYKHRLNQILSVKKRQAA
jgi:hypothetical protein